MLCAVMLCAPHALADPTANEPAPAVSDSELRAVAADPEAARKAEAQAHRLQALMNYDSGDYPAAKREFERANQLMPSFRLLYNLGVVSIALADPASAYDYFERYLAEGGTDIAPEARAELKRELGELAKQLALVVVAVDTPGAAVFVDDTRVGVAPLARPLRLNPGRRLLSARLPDTRRTSRTVTLVAGETTRAELNLPPPPRAVSQRSVRAQRRVFWVGWAATAALAAGSVAAGLEALSAQHRYQDTFGRIGTSREDLDDLSARTTRWSVAADTLDGAAMIIGAYSLYMTLRHSPPETRSASSTFSIRVLSNEARLSLNF